MDVQCKLSSPSGPESWWESPATPAALLKWRPRYGSYGRSTSSHPLPALSAQVTTELWVRHWIFILSRRVFHDGGVFWLEWQHFWEHWTDTLNWYYVHVWSGVKQLVCQSVSLSTCPVQFFFLADTEKLYTEVTQSIVDRYGKTYDWSIKTQVMGRPPLDAAKVAVELLELPLTPMEFHTELYSKLNSKFPDANMMPGVV